MTLVVSYTGGALHWWCLTLVVPYIGGADGFTRAGFSSLLGTSGCGRLLSLATLAYGGGGTLGSPASCTVIAPTAAMVAAKFRAFSSSSSSRR